MEQTKEIDIDLRKIFYMMRTKVIFIVLITLFMGIAAGCYTHFFVDPVYSATVKLYVYSNTDRVSSDASISVNEIDASQRLVNTYIYILKSDTVLEKVSTQLDLGLSADSIKGCISASQVDETEAFQVTVSTTDPSLSAKIANAIAEIAPEEIVRVAKAGGVEVIDYAKEPTSPSSPNTKKNMLVGALAGFFVSFAGFFIYEMFDSTITNAKDIEREFEIPVLGTVPRLEAVEKADESASISINSSKSEFVHPRSKPSSELLDNINAMRGDGKNE